MSSFAVIHKSRSNALSVDVVRSKRGTACLFRVYWMPTASSRARLRAVWRLHPKRVYVFNGWSQLREKAFKEYCVRLADLATGAPSLDYLSTSGRRE